jgi:hypothetical protein
VMNCCQKHNAVLPQCMHWLKHAQFWGGSMLTMQNWGESCKNKKPYCIQSSLYSSA